MEAGERERRNILSPFGFQVFGFQHFSVHQLFGFQVLGTILYSGNVVSLWSYVCVFPASSVLLRNIYRIIIDFFM